ncbi:acetylcholine receptor subunit epsilon isoform X2 [Anguilla anguilla]|uniref:acetylcholine receptor subunit epsilon isoform X2 n=1 Tax=Anguilla anguilla TaxID=7936 RepID=UPI0015A88B90|nr:acetylcholine receptor subunit epsilon isoform X2 [Anguilla anguilla]
MVNTSNTAMAGRTFWSSLAAVSLLLLIMQVSGNEESQLIKDIMTGYNKNIRPAEHPGDKVQVQLKLTLTNLISLNEKEETLTTNVWIEIQWHDYRLAWNETLYYGISVVRVPYSTVWLPDIVLENKSQTYSANEVDLILAVEEGVTIEWVAIDPEAFTENGEWAIRHRPARKVINHRYSPDDLEYQEVHFGLVIQRKPLFYIINIILPCSLISSLVVLAYFLPAQAGGQKLTVSISVLLAQTVFLILVSQKIPQTSLSVPLIGKYLIFVMSVTTLIVTNCIIVLNYSLRSPSSHNMSRSIKHVFLEVVPRFLGVSYLGNSDDENAQSDAVRERRGSTFNMMQRAEEYMLKHPRSEIMFDRLKERHGLGQTFVDGIDVSTTASLYKSLAQAAPEIKDCVDACNFITESTKQQNDIGSEIENWVLIGKMIDKVCFWVALLLFSLGTVAIFLTGHFNQAPEFPFPGEDKRYAPILPTSSPEGQGDATSQL